MKWANAVVQGVLLGGLYALYASGLSLIFGVMRVVNLAHGDLSILAAYLAVVLVGATGMTPLLTLAVVAPVMFGLGYGLQRGLINFTLGGGQLPPLLVTFALAVIVQNALLEGFSADSRGLNAGRIEGISIDLTGRLAVGWFPLIILLSAVVLLIGLQILFTRTQFGRVLRATADDREAAELVAINNRHLYAVAMGLALTIVGVAGVFLGVRTTFGPLEGPTLLIFAFEAVIIGGLGSLWGTLAGGIILGIAQTIGAQLAPGWAQLTGHLVFLAILAFRPVGLFGRPGVQVET
ncbi:MAG: branched-chain amino acid ABC transporter permease [Actinomycetota bacterium]